MLLDVFRSLSSQTNRRTANAVPQRLWLASVTPAEWTAASYQFQESVAVMSMLGYIVGLGDRHLDNILLDPTTGHVIHIDLNVCFDKGLRLPVPETVPFRLTNMIVGGLGPSGINGVCMHQCICSVRSDVWFL